MNVYMGATMVAKRTIGTISYWTQVDTIQWLHRNHRQEVIYTETADHTDPNYIYNGPTIAAHICREPSVVAARTSFRPEGG